MKNNSPHRLNLLTSLLTVGLSLPASAAVFSPLPTDITEPAGIYFPLQTNSLRLDVKTVLGTGPCEIDNYKGCTLTDVDADTDSRDDFKPEVKVHIVMDSFPDDGLVSNATFRQRGNSSRFANQKSYRIKLDSKEDLWRGERKLQLNKHPWDLSRVANKLSFDLMQDMPHIPSLRTDFVNMFVDNVDYGLFTHIENVGKEYLKRRGWDKDSGVYKADHFDFVMGEAYTLTAEGKPLDPQWFNSKLEIKRGKNQRKLVEMMGVVNNPTNNFSTDVMEKYFNKNNYLSWLSVNFLFGNQDAVGINADNFYLLNPKGEDTFYFLPWDYDEAWLESTWDTANDIHQSRAWTGVSAYWSSLLHQRYLKQPGAIAELREAVDHIKNTYLTPTKIASKLNAYTPLVRPLISVSPDLQDLPVTGNILTITEYLDNYNNMYSAVQNNYSTFINSIQYPMGFWIKKAELTGNILTLDWSPSYDLQGDSITYDVQISTKPEFTPSTIVENITGLTTTDYVYNWNLPTNFYYVRILARDSANPIEHWQVAFNEYVFNNHEYHGVMPLQETTPPIDPPTDPVVIPLCEMGVDPQTIRQGEGTALWWWSQDASTGSIDNGIGNTALPSEYKWIHPTQTTTYTMSIANASGGNFSCNTTIIVESTNTGGDLVAPSVPQGLNLTSTTPNSVNINWTASTDNSGSIAPYHITRDGIEIGTSTVPSYTDNTVLAETAYVYSVIAEDSSSNKSVSSVDLNVVTPAVVTPPTTNDLTLLAGYAFEQESGQTVLDLSGNGNNGTLTGGATRNPDGNTGKAIEFNGSNSAIDLGNLDITTPNMSIALWFKADDFGTSDARLISKANGTASSAHYWMISTIRQSGQQKLRFRLKTDNGGTSTLIGNTTLTSDTWTHVTATYDGVNMKLFQAGIEVGSLAKTGAISTSPSVNASIGANPGNTRYFDGLIDDVRIYGEALDTTAIQNIVVGNSPLIDGGSNNNDTEAPTSPSNLTAQLVATQVNLNWTASTDNSGTIALYHITRDGIEIGISTVPSFTDNTVLAETTYVYSIIAEDSSNNKSASSVDLNVVTPAVVTPPTTNDPALLAGYAFEQESGQTILDLSRNGNNGTLTGGATRNPNGNTGKAIEFNGSNSAIDLGNLDITTPNMSITLWFKADDFGTSDARLISKANGTASSAHYWMISTIRQSGLQKLRFRLKTDNGGTSTLIGNTTLTPGSWTHVTATYDGVNMKLFQDGIEMGSLAKTGAISTSPSVNASIGANPGDTRYFDGLIDDVRIYGEALDTATIQSVIAGEQPMTDI